MFNITSTFGSELALDKAKDIKDDKLAERKAIELKKYVIAATYNCHHQPNISNIAINITKYFYVSGCMFYCI